MTNEARRRRSRDTPRTGTHRDVLAPTLSKALVAMFEPGHADEEFITCGLRAMMDVKASGLVEPCDGQHALEHLTQSSFRPTQQSSILLRANSDGLVPVLHVALWTLEHFFAETEDLAEWEGCVSNVAQKVITTLANERASQNPNSVSGARDAALNLLRKRQPRSSRPRPDA